MIDYWWLMIDYWLMIDDWWLMIDYWWFWWLIEFLAFKGQRAPKCFAGYETSECTLKFQIALNHMLCWLWIQRRRTLKCFAGYEFSECNLKFHEISNCFQPNALLASTSGTEGAQMLCWLWIQRQRAEFWEFWELCLLQVLALHMIGRGQLPSP